MAVRAWLGSHDGLLRQTGVLFGSAQGLGGAKRNAPTPAIGTGPISG